MLNLSRKKLGIFRLEQEKVLSSRIHSIVGTNSVENSWFVSRDRKKSRRIAAVMVSAKTMSSIIHHFAVCANQTRLVENPAGLEKLKNMKTVCN